MASLDKPVCNDKVIGMQQPRHRWDYPDADAWVSDWHVEGILNSDAVAAGDMQINAGPVQTAVPLLYWLWRY